MKLILKSTLWLAGGGKSRYPSGNSSEEHKVLFPEEFPHQYHYTSFLINNSRQWIKLLIFFLILNYYQNDSAIIGYEKDEYYSNNTADVTELAECYRKGEYSSAHCRSEHVDQSVEVSVTYLKCQYIIYTY